MEYLISSAVGFLLGSIPSAYLIVKKTKGINILDSGSGNAGAYNSYEVSNSKFIGLLVLLADTMKGTLSVLVPILIYPDIFVTAGLSLLFAVLAHCYNPWIGFRGGRGLATAAGGAVVILPFLFLVWSILWVIFYLMKRDISLSNIAATIMALIILFITSDIAVKYTFLVPENQSTLVVLTTAILVIIFIKHIEPLKELISKEKAKR